MIRNSFRLLAMLLVGVVFSAAVIENAKAGFHFRRRCCTICCVTVTCQPSTPITCQSSTPVNCQPSTTHTTGDGMERGPVGTPRDPETEPKELPKISEVPRETPELVVPNAVKALGENAATQSESELTLASLADMRTWTATDGRVCVARFIALADDSVILLKGDRSYTVPLNRLCDSDVLLVKAEYLRAILASK